LVLRFQTPIEGVIFEFWRGHTRERPERVVFDFKVPDPH